MIVEHGTLVVVADGGGAIVYRNADHEGAARLEVVETHDTHNKSFTHEMRSDKPGRYPTPAGGRSAVENFDHHDDAERKFAKRLVTRLDELIGAHVHGKAQPRVILFAPPRFLGMIRPDYSARLKAALQAEIGKDMRDAAPKDIAHALIEADHG